MHALKYITATALALALARTAAAQQPADTSGAYTCGVLVGIAIGVTLVALLIPTLWLWLAARLTKLSGTFKTALGAVLLSLLFTIPFNLVLRAFLEDPSSARSVGLLNLLTIPVAALAVKFAYSTSYPRALLTYTVSSVISLVSVVVAVVAIVVLAGATGHENEVTRALREAWDSKEFVTLSSEASKTESEAVSLPLADARAHVGEKVRVVLNDGNVVDGTLEEVGPEVLTIRQRIGGGSVTIPVRKSRIGEFQLLIPPK